MRIIRLFVIIFLLILSRPLYCAFSAEDLASFNRVTTGDFSAEELRNLSQRPVSYFQSTLPSLWVAQNTNAEVSLTAYLAIINSVVFSTGSGNTLSFSVDTTGLPQNGQGYFIFDSLSQLLNSLVGGVGSSNVPAAVEQLAETQQLLSILNAGLIGQQQSTNPPSTYTINFSNSPGSTAFPTIEELISSYSGVAIPPNNFSSFLDYVNSCIVVAFFEGNPPPTLGRKFSFYIPDSFVIDGVSGFYVAPTMESFVQALFSPYESPAPSTSGLASAEGEIAFLEVFNTRFVSFQSGTGFTPQQLKQYVDQPRYWMVFSSDLTNQYGLFSSFDDLTQSIMEIMLA